MWNPSQILAGQMDVNATNRDLARKNLLRFQLQIYWAHSDSVGRISAIQ